MGRTEARNHCRDGKGLGVIEYLENGIAVIAGDTHFAVWVREHNSLVHDKWKAEQCCRHIKSGDVVINAGANIGTLCRPMIDAGATVIAFEPNPEAVECLRHNCPEAQIFPLGLSDRVTSGKFHVKRNAGASYFRGKGDDLLVPLDQYHFEAKYNVRFILADVEGYELKFLRGARGLIDKCKPVMILEVNLLALYRAGDGPEELFDHLDSLGYNRSILQPDITDWDSSEYDILCVPR